MNNKQLYHSPTLTVRYMEAADVCTTSYLNDEVQDDVYGGLFY